jgi:hypothetical protein
MNIYPSLAGPCLAGFVVCFSLGCSSSNGAANVDGGGADQSAQHDDAALDANAGDGGLPSPPYTGGGGPPVCTDVCCMNPPPGAGCDGGALDASCSAYKSCGPAHAANLNLAFTVMCNGQQWVAVGGDCGDAGIADNGCPVTQPLNGAACTLDAGTSCQYGIMCSGTCDAGSGASDAAAQQAGDGSSGSNMAGTGCASISGKVGPAICGAAGQWQTQALGTCP